MILGRRYMRCWIVIINMGMMDEVHSFPLFEVDLICFL